MSFDGTCELSVIVPVFNEIENLEALFECLSRQRSVRLELVVSDGGSSDGTAPLAMRLAERAPFPCRTLSGGKGRGGQMNRGAALASADLLLFLHADSSFADPLALRKGIDALLAATAQGGARLAGHFPLSFSFPAPAPLPYRYYEEKARLDRPGCTHGDQGLLIGRAFFEEVGPFSEAVPLMEDTLLAERIRAAGRWVLLPAPIETSPRRFQAEGLLPRQTLNAVLMNLAALGRLDLLPEIRSSYRTHDASQRLRLGEFFLPLGRAIAALPWRDRFRFWYRTGGYVRANAWQIPFFLDVLLSDGNRAGTGRFLRMHVRHVEPLLDNRGGRIAATLLVWGWFRLATLYLWAKAATGRE